MCLPIPAWIHVGVLAEDPQDKEPRTQTWIQAGAGQADEDTSVSLAPLVCEGAVTVDSPSWLRDAQLQIAKCSSGITGRGAPGARLDSWTPDAEEVGLSGRWPAAGMGPKLRAT